MWSLTVKNPSGNISYTLQDTNTDSTTWKKFVILNVNGTYVLKLNQTLDYEVSTFFTLFMATIDTALLTTRTPVPVFGSSNVVTAYFSQLHD